MLSKKLQDAMNEQMKNEFYSAYLYKGMQAYFEGEELKGFGNWFRVQALEELTHGDKFFAFINEAGGKAELRAIDAVPVAYKSPLQAYEAALKHEQFVTEQVEEEANATSYVRKLKLVKGDGRGILLLDQEAGQRVFTPPAP